MAQNELVSFIVPLYNVKREEIDKSIQSMLSQTYKNVEIIICDDASTNGIYDYLTEKYGDNAQITILRNEKNMKAGFSYNRCIEVAKGEYIAVQDGDDYSSVDRIEKQIEFLKNNPEYDFVSAGLEKVDEQGAWGRIVLKETPDKRDFKYSCQHAHATTLFRVECLKSIDGYKPGREFEGTEDYELFMRLYANGFKGYNLQDILYYYNIPRTGRKYIKYKYSINEARARSQNFKAMKLPLKDRLYVLKPLIAGLFSEKFKNCIKKLLRRSKK